MSASLLPPPPPRSSPVIDPGDVFSNVWSGWFRQLWQLIGGPSSSIAVLQAQVTTLQGQVATLQSQVATLQTLSNSLLEVESGP